MAVTGAGRVYTSGNNGYGQLGIGNKPCAFLDVEGFYAPLIGMTT